MLNILKTIWSFSNALASIVYNFIMGFIIIILFIVGMVFMAFRCGRAEMAVENKELTTQIKHYRWERDSFFRVAEAAQSSEWLVEQNYNHEHTLRVKAERGWDSTKKERDQIADQLLVSQDSNGYLVNQLISTQEELQANYLLVSTEQQKNDSLDQINKALAFSLKEKSQIAERVIFAEDYLHTAKNYLVVSSVSLVFSMFVFLLVLKVKYQTLSTAFEESSRKWISTFLKEWYQLKRTLKEFLASIFRTYP